METNRIERINALTRAMGVSGEEKDVRDLLKQSLTADEWISDRLGSIFALKKSKNENAKKLMIATSLDELGLMVSDILPSGELAFVALENISPASLLHQKICVYTREHEAFFGVVGCHSKKFMEEAVKEIKMDELTLDMGMDFEEAKKHFTIGDLVSFHGGLTELNDTTIMSKSLNNRLLLEAIIEINARLKEVDLDYELIMGGIAQSIVGWRGTKTATYVVEPDCAFALCGFETNNAKPAIQRGKGMVVGVYDKQMLPGKRLLHDFQSKNETAQKYLGNYGNDGSFIHKTLKGTPTLSLGLPISHIGSCHEIADLKDLDNFVEAMVTYLTNLSSSDIEEFGYGVSHD